MAIRADQVGASGSFGFVPLLVGTLLISFVAMVIAVPVGLMSAIYLSEYASRRFRSFTKPVLEILAGVPTVVYGFFAALTVVALLKNPTYDADVLREQLHGYHQCIRRWATACPENYGHKLHLIDAEIADALGDFLERFLEDATAP